MLVITDKRTSGEEKKKSQLMRSKKSFQNSGLISGNCAADRRAELTNTGSTRAGRSPPPPGAEFRAGERNYAAMADVWEESFLHPARCLSPLTLQLQWGADSPRSCASDVTSNVTSRKRWRSPALRFQGSGVKLERAAPSGGHLRQMQHLQEAPCALCIYRKEKAQW